MLKISLKDLKIFFIITMLKEIRVNPLNINGKIEILSTKIYIIKIKSIKFVELKNTFTRI